MILLVGILSDIIDMNGVHDSKCIKSIPFNVCFVASRPPFLYFKTALAAGMSSRLLQWPMPVLQICERPECIGQGLA